MRIDVSVDCMYRKAQIYKVKSIFEASCQVIVILYKKYSTFAFAIIRSHAANRQGE